MDRARAADEGEPSGWDQVYRQGAPPWETGRPQPALTAEASRMSSPVLDVGCGTGENALALAALGLEVVGLDISPTAIAEARQRAAERGISVTFEVGDARALAGSTRRVRTVVDSGLFHALAPGAEAGAYVAGLRHVLKPGGMLLLLCFSDRQPGSFGPRRVSEAEIRETFAKGWRVESVAPAAFETRLPSGPAQAWRARMVRLPD